MVLLALIYPFELPFKAPLSGFDPLTLREPGICVIRLSGRSQGSCEKDTMTSWYGPGLAAFLKNSSLTVRAMAVAENTTVAKSHQ